MHPAAGHLWRQVSMVALINATTHQSDWQESRDEFMLIEAVEKWYAHYYFYFVSLKP